MCAYIGEVHSKWYVCNRFSQIRSHTLVSPKLWETNTFLSSDIFKCTHAQSHTCIEVVAESGIGGGGGTKKIIILNTQKKCTCSNINHTSASYKIHVFICYSSLNKLKKSFKIYIEIYGMWTSGHGSTNNICVKD